MHPATPRRHGRPALHLRHNGPAQGRRADQPQSACPARSCRAHRRLRLCGRRCDADRDAGLPHRRRLYGAVSLSQGARGIVMAEVDPAAILKLIETGAGELCLYRAGRNPVAAAAAGGADHRLFQPAARHLWRFADFRSRADRGADDHGLRLHPALRADGNHGRHRLVCRPRIMWPAVRASGLCGIAYPETEIRVVDGEGKSLCRARGRRDRDPLAHGHEGLLEQAGGDRRRDRRMAGSAPAMPAISTKTAISTSTTG